MVKDFKMGLRAKPGIDYLSSFSILLSIDETVCNIEAIKSIREA